jgi:hypothetical protein
MVNNQFDVPTSLDDFLQESTNRSRVVGAWGFNSHINFTEMNSEESNVWFFEQVFNFLRSFFGLVIPGSLEITTYNGKEQISRDNLDQMTFLDELMLIMKGLKEPIWVLRLNLNIVGFLRTDFNPDMPIRLQIQEPASFVIWGGPDETGFQTFSIGYQLFSAQKIEGEHNLLWSMNQPMLEKVLKKWEAQSQHRIEVVESNSDDLPIYRHGFDKPTPPKPRAKAKQDEGPFDDFMPDLDDIGF